MADGRIEIETGINTSGAEKGLGKLTNMLKGVGGGSVVKGLGNLGLAFGGVTAAVQVAAKAVGAVKAAINDLTEAYKVQKQAETQLQQAAKNNPYLLSESVDALKNYASELQNISTYGDEQLLPFMAKLAAAGRSQDEIMQIMSASVDMAASGTISLDGAVDALNKSYSGSIGLLGKQIGELQGLTAEDLKNGKAVEVVAKKYKGMAEEVAKVTGTSQQLKNAVGDLKEELGAPFEKAMSPIRAFFTELIGGWAAAKRQKREYDEAVENIAAGKATTSDYEKKISEVKEQLAQAREELLAVQQTIADGESDLSTAYALSAAQARLQSLNTEYASYMKMKERVAKAEKDAAENAKKEEAAAQERAKRNERNQLAASALQGYSNSVEEIEKEIKTRRELGETISKIEEKQMLYEAKKAAYMQMIKAAQGAISGNAEREKKTREEILGLARELAAYENSAEGLADKYAEKGSEREIEIPWAQQKQELEAAREAIKELQQSITNDSSLQIDERIELEKKYAAAIEEINKEIAEGENQSNVQRLESIKSITDQVCNYINQTASVMNNAMSLMLESVKNESRAEQAELEKKYKNGELSEEEYNEAVTESKRKAAREQYKIQMVQWGAQLLQATANIAQGVTKAIADGGVMGMITGALVAAAGGVQIASIIASKPTPPSFSTGGIIGGSSYHGDNIAANLNSREMVMNQAQQKGLWDFINGGSNGAGNGANIVINNSAANIVNAQPQITRGQIEIMIDARVNDSLKNGRYNNSLSQAQQGMGGDFYGI